MALEALGVPLRHEAGSTAIAKISSKAGRAEARTEIAGIDSRVWTQTGDVRTEIAEPRLQAHSVMVGTMMANTVDSRRFSRISPRSSDDDPIIFTRQQDRGHGARRGQQQADAACRDRDDLFQLHHGARVYDLSESDPRHEPRLVADRDLLVDVDR